jgi:small-conductance mechanosensitive channel
LLSGGQSLKEGKIVVVVLALFTISVNVGFLALIAGLGVGGILFGILQGRF